MVRDYLLQYTYSPVSVGIAIKASLCNCKEMREEIISLLSNTIL